MFPVYAYYRRIGRCKEADRVNCEWKEMPSGLDEVDRVWIPEGSGRPTSASIVYADSIISSKKILTIWFRMRIYVWVLKY